MQTREAASQSHKVTYMDDRRLANSVSEEMEKRRQLNRQAEPTIFRAPKTVRSSDPDAYKPKLVSIGPYHRAKSKADFKPMEELKWRLLDNYVSKASENGEASKDCIGRLLREMRRFEQEARNCYSEVIDLGSDEFVKMLLLDGCFLVQIFSFWTRKPEERPQELNNMWSPFLLFRDLLLLENQIPYFVVNYLLNELRIEGGDVSLTALEIFNRYFWKLEIPPSKASLEDSEVHHFLHLFHRWILHNLKERRKTDCEEPSPRRPSSALSSLKNKTRDRFFKMNSCCRGASDPQLQEPLVDAISYGSSSVVIPSGSGAPLFNETKVGSSEAFLSCSAAELIDEIAPSEVIRPRGSAASLITPPFNETKMGSSEVFLSCSEAALIDEIAPSEVIRPKGSAASLITPLFNETKTGSSEVFLSYSEAALIDEIAPSEVEPVGSTASLITPPFNETKMSSEVSLSSSEAALIDEIAPRELFCPKSSAAARVHENAQSSIVICLSSSIPEINKTTDGSSKEDSLKLQLSISSVTALADAGIKFKARKVDNFLDISFHKDKGILEIPAIMVDDYTNFIFRNLIAFEQCYKKSYHESNNTSTSAREFFEMKVTDYTLFMDGIINTPRDVELLCEKGIIHRNLGSDKEIARLFNKLGKGVIYAKEGNYLGQVYKDVKDYCESPWHRHRARLMHDYFSNPWAIISVVAAAALFALTILQTVYSALSYHLV